MKRTLAILGLTVMAFAAHGRARGDAVPDVAHVWPPRQPSPIGIRDGERPVRPPEAVGSDRSVIVSPARRALPPRDEGHGFLGRPTSRPLDPWDPAASFLDHRD